MSAGSWVTIGVVADTHIPDRVQALHPRILPELRAAGVQHILHAGDISSRSVLRVLAQVAPVRAVRGNRDFLAGRLRMTERLTVNGRRITLVHGHFGLLPYLVDKWHFWRDGYRLERYLDALEKAGGDVVVFGHTHYSETFWRGGRYYMNPGSASFGPRLRGRLPSIGLLRIGADGQVEGEILRLRGYHVENRAWAPGER